MRDESTRADSRDAAATVCSLRERIVLLVGVGGVNTAIYLLLDAFPRRPPTLLTYTPLDAALPRITWTIWPYWLLLLIGPLMALCLRRRSVLRQTVRGYAIALSLNAAIWFAWPTRIIRQPLPDSLHGLTRYAWNLLLQLDQPNNCFPSGHLTIPIVIGAGLCVQNPKLRAIIWPLIVILAPTIITTGQHYSWDIAGGVGTALIGIRLARQRN